MARYEHLGKWLRRKREERGISSAAAVAKRAKLSYNYISILERGEIRPKSSTVQRISDALGLSQAERRELHRLAKTAGEPEHVAEALSGGSAVHGSALFGRLPELLYRVKHHGPATGTHHADDMYVDSVRSLGALLAWLKLSDRTVPRSAREELHTQTKAIARQESRDAVARRLRRFGVDIPSPAWHAVSALPHMWQSLVFGSQRGAARAVSPLVEWRYTSRWVPGAAMLGVRLKGPAYQRFAFELAPVALVLHVHNAMIAARLLEATNLDELSPDGNFHRDQLNFRPNIDYLQTRSPDQIQANLLADRLDDWTASVDACERLQFALRLYEVPALGHELLGMHRAELADLVAAADSAIERAITRLDTAPARTAINQPGGAT